MVFASVLVLIPQIKEPMGGLCQLLSVNISIIHLRPGKMATGFVNTTDPLREIKVRTPFTTWIPLTAALIEESIVTLPSMSTCTIVSSSP